MKININHINDIPSNAGVQLGRGTYENNACLFVEATAVLYGSLSFLCCVAKTPILKAPTKKTHNRINNKILR